MVEVGCVNMKGWLLIETLLVLLVANAITWFVVAMGRERTTSGVRTSRPGLF